MGALEKEVATIEAELSSLRYHPTECVDPIISRPSPFSAAYESIPCGLCKACKVECDEQRVKMERIEQKERLLQNYREVRQQKREERAQQQRRLSGFR